MDKDQEETKVVQPVNHPPAALDTPTQYGSQRSQSEQVQRRTTAKFQEGAKRCEDGDKDRKIIHQQRKSQWMGDHQHGRDHRQRMVQLEKRTAKQLAEWNVPYKELRTGHKMFADVYVDDKAVKDTDFFGGSNEDT